MAAVKKSSSASSGGNDKLCAALSYVLIGIIWYFVDEEMKKSSLARWHAKQGVAMLILSIIMHIVFWIFALVFFTMPFMFGIWAIVGIIETLIWIGFLILWLMGLIGALQGKENRLPIASGIAEKFDF